MHMHLVKNDDHITTLWLSCSFYLAPKVDDEEEMENNE